MTTLFPPDIARAPLNLAGHFQQGRFDWRGELPRGIYRVSVLFDAERVDWEKFFLPMQDYGNAGQRTGPWDFDFNGARPLVPAWWFSQGDERLGLAICARPSVSQLNARRLEMRFCFEVEAGGETSLGLQPYNDFDLDVLHFQIRPESDDVPRAVALQDAPNFAQYQAQNQVLGSWHNKLQTSSAHYRPLVEKAIAYAKKTPNAELLPLLTWAARECNDDQARAVVFATLQELIAAEHWGNPLPDGYGHDGDMGVASIIEALSFVLQWIQVELESEGLYEPLRDKLLLQMRRFYQIILLTNGFWGGSILQDHGHRSISRFGVAAINLLGVLPEARKWLEFVVQRMDRVLAALPPDGAIPFSSYHKIQLYMDDMTTWRDALKHATGRDIFESGLFPSIVAFVANRLYEPTREVLCVSPRGDRKDFYAGWGFFNAIAALHHDHDAARLSEILRDHYMTRSMVLRPAATLLTALAHDQAIEARPLRPALFDRRFDTGLVSYRPQTDIQVALRCAVPGSLHSYYRVNGPCDRIKDAPLEGHFSVSIGGQTLLLTAEGGYRMRSSLGCCLLIDGKGAYGDEDYAMGIPGVTYRGEQIETAWCDETKREAYVRMNLACGYAREARLLLYYREFFLRPDGLLCRDVVLSSAEHEYSWNFQTYARRQIETLDEGSFRISDGTASVTLSGQCAEEKLKASTGATEIVWAYQNENNDEKFAHIRFATAEKVKALTAEFSVVW